MSKQHEMAFGCPLWVPSKKVMHFFSIGAKRLTKWEREGFVRSVKLNNAKSGARLYYTPDLDDILLNLAAGCEPRSKLGKKIDNKFVRI